MKSLRDNFDLIAVIALVMALAMAPEIRRPGVQRISFSHPHDVLTQIFPCLGR